LLLNLLLLLLLHLTRPNALSLALCPFSLDLQIQRSVEQHTAVLLPSLCAVLLL
jgi:hypothetical protein